jgi:hypothetical protein
MTLTQAAGERAESTDVYTDAPGTAPNGPRKITQVEENTDFARPTTTGDANKEKP